MYDSSTHVVVRLRALAPYGISETQTELIARLRRLIADGTLTHIDIAVWGPEIEATPSDPADSSSIRETFLEFDHWARSHGYTLAPAFYRRSAGSVVDEHQLEVIMCPLICFGIYEGQTVRAVYPYSDGATVHTIHDGVEELESIAKEQHHESITIEPAHPVGQMEPGVP